mmetsp:Transcript_5567/g.15763  ORF Transcript_5567/g.15763 Transcript_5567/m.15763 type:complete len:380 (-) Transcript_5567:497-1636(-)
MRGRSSRRHAKKQYKLELREGPEAEDADREAALLGMPPHEDWIVAGDYVDRSLMRNALGYALARAQGRWAPRQEFVELYLAQPGAAQVNVTDYAGVYVLREAIRQGEGRVDVNKYKNGTDDSGFILEFRSRSHESMFNNGDEWETHIMDTGPSRVYLQYPARGASDEDTQWLRDAIVGAERLLYSSPDMADAGSWPSAFDPQAMVDYFLAVELTHNLDGYISSTFFHLNKGGKLVAGPLWDLDLAFGNSNNWRGTYASPQGGFTMWGPNQSRNGRVSQWFGKLVSDDAAFKREAGRRWRQLRAGAWSDAGIRQLVAELQGALAGAAPANFQKWPLSHVGTGDSRIWLVGHRGSWEGEVQHLLDWTLQRARWLDGQMQGW